MRQGKSVKIVEVLFGTNAYNRLTEDDSKDTVECWEAEKLEESLQKRFGVWVLYGTHSRMCG